MRNELTGSREVFRFTLRQFLWSKSTIVTLVVLLIAVVGGLFIASYSIDSEEMVNTISAVYIDNQTDIALSAEDIAAASGLSELHTAANAAESDAQLTISRDDQGYMLSATGDAHSARELNELENAGLTALNAARWGALATPYTAEVESVDEYLNPQDDEADNFSGRFTVSYVYSFVVMMLVMLSAGYIIHSVIEEKASRLVETLMLSVKPLALIVGKIAASMCMVLIELSVLLLGCGAAILITRYVLRSNMLETMLASSGLLSALVNLNAFSIVALVFTVLLGYLSFSIIAGLSGACCDRMEDADAASMTVMFITMGSYMISMVASALDGAASVVFSLLPFVSVFTAPVKYMLGDITLPILLLSWVIQAAVALGLMLFCRRVYAELIIRRGERIRFKDLMRLGKTGGVRA